MKAPIAVAMILISLCVLEFARSGVEITRFAVGKTPVVEYSTGADGPVVVIAHGFAGSQQMMQGYALPLARAGYRVFAFDFLGHGQNSVPMSGDITVVEGTTQVLVAQTHAVIDAVSSEGPVALIGHSMATDILVRAAKTRDDIGPIVLVSAFSQVIDDVFPKDLLLVSGAWESGLRTFGLKAARMVSDVKEGETALAGEVQRRAVAAPFSEHVSVLQSRIARVETVAWLDRAFGRVSDVRILPTGWAILGLFGGLVLVFPSVLSRVPSQAVSTPVITWKQFAALVGVPMLIAPLIAVPLNPNVLPVLVADYLGLHLLIFGTLQLVTLWMWGVRLNGPSWRIVLVLLLWCIVFGVALDRYAANFTPTSERVWIIAVLALGGMPYMLADGMLTSTGFWRRVFARIGFLVSLGIAVALDFDGLFFLMMIAPVLVLFYLVFGTMGRIATARSGPLGSGLILGLVLAWALGVSFPLFQS